MIRNADEMPGVKSSVYIIRHFPLTYTYISKLFYKETGITILRFIIKHKMEYAKKFLDDGYTLDDIAHKPGYNDAAHLSKIFKKTPSAVSDTQRIATPTIVTKAHKATFSEGASHYIWSDWIYVVIP